MKTAFSIVISISISVILLFPGLGQAETNLNYVNVKFGAIFPTDDLDDTGFDTGFAGEIAYGRYLLPCMAVEFGIGVYNTDMSEQEPGYPAVGTGKEENDITVIPVTATVKGFYTLGPVELFAGIGGGFHYAEIDNKISVSGYDDIDMKADDTVLGFHAVLGAIYNVSDCLFFGLEGKHVWTGDAHFKDEFLGIPIEAETNLNGYFASAILGYRF